MEVSTKTYLESKNSYIKYYIAFVYLFLYKCPSHFETKKSLYDLRMSLMFGIFFRILYGIFLTIYFVNKKAILMITATIVWLLATIILLFMTLLHISHKVIEYTVSC